MPPFSVSFSPLGLSAAHVSIVVAWLVFSFLFWRALRNVAVDEDRIFDLTFYATLIGLVMARLGYVVSHWELFAGKSWLLIPALWILPGFAWLTGLVGGLATLVLLSRQYKVRLGLVLDSIAVSLPLPILLGEAGSFLAGVEQGKQTTMLWGIRMGNEPFMRHPIQFYEMIGLLLLLALTIRMTVIAVKKKWPYGILGIWFLFWYSVSQFILEFAKDTRVYWGSLSANQWVLIGIFAECIGVLYIRGGGREWMRPHATKIGSTISRLRKGLYGLVSRKHVDGT